MSELDSLALDTSIEDEKDTLGGGGAQESGIKRNLLIEMAYLDKSRGGALSLNLHLRNADGDVLRAQLWITSGKAKGCKNYYERNGKKNYLPGFNLANALAMMTIGKDIGEVCKSIETRSINRWDFESSSEIPMKTEVVIDLLNQKITVGLLKQTVEKNVKQGDKYVPSGETRDENEVDKFFDAETDKTLSETKAGDDATFINDWEAKWAGKTKDKTTKEGDAVRKNGGTVKAGAPTTASPAVDSIFAKNA